MNTLIRGSLGGGVDMGDIINLNHYRKAKRHAEKEQKASENRAKSGRAKFEKLNQRSMAALEEARHSGHSLKGHQLEGQDPSAPEKSRDS